MSEEKRVVEVSKTEIETSHFAFQPSKRKESGEEPEVENVFEKLVRIFERSHVLAHLLWEVFVADFCWGESGFDGAHEVLELLRVSSNHGANIDRMHDAKGALLASVFDLPSVAGSEQMSEDRTVTGDSILPSELLDPLILSGIQRDESFANSTWRPGISFE